MPQGKSRSITIAPATRRSTPLRKPPAREEKSADHLAKEAADRVDAVLTRLEARQVACSKEIARLQKRKACAVARFDRIENDVIAFMKLSQMTKADGWHVCLKLKPCPPSVDVFDEVLIPKEYLRVKEVTAPDKPAIRQAIEAQIPIPGARLIQNVSLVRK